MCLSRILEPIQSLSRVMPPIQPYTYRYFLRLLLISIPASECLSTRWCCRCIQGRVILPGTHMRQPCLRVGSSTLFRGMKEEGVEVRCEGVGEGGFAGSWWATPLAL